MSRFLGRAKVSGGIALAAALASVGCAAGSNKEAPGSFASSGSSAGSGTLVGGGSGGDASTAGGGDDATILGNGGDDASSSFSVPEGSTTGCVPKSCEDLGLNCGQVLDGCGNLIQCGGCDGGVCGAGDAANVCSVGVALGPDGGPCVPATCTSLDANCGPIADGCGNLLQCGQCEAGTSCGIGGTPNVCSVGSPEAGCSPLTCAAQNIFCGMAGDGCGATLDCGSCVSPNTCGGGGKAGVCGAPVCTPSTCAAQGIACGPAGDGCGGMLQCGNPCPSWQTCGGAGNPGQCGCTGVCAEIPTCTGNATTTLTGVAMDPGGVNPLYNALVYIPNDPTDPALTSPLQDGITCDVCGANAAGSPLVTTYSKTDGSFVLPGAPSGSSIMLVVQLGRWRRIFQVSIPSPCSMNMVTGTGTGGATIQGGILTMPKNKGEGDIPLTVVVTGDADALECVLWKAGVDEAEFTNPGGTGRINIVTGSGHDVTTGIAPAAARTNERGWINTCTNGPAGVACTAACPGATCTLNRFGGGAVVDANTPSEMVLYQINGAPATYPLTDYDLTVLSCQGWPWMDAVSQPSLAHYPELVAYANGGGRVFATHFSSAYYRYTAGGVPNAFTGSAAWGTTPGVAFNADGTGVVPKAGFVDINPLDNPKGAAFAAWLGNPMSALSMTPAWMTMPANDPTVMIYLTKWDTTAVIPPTQQWMFMSPPDDDVHFDPLVFTFNTPIGAASTAQCGRGLYTDFHVTPNTAGGGGLQGTHNLVFPAECGARSPMSAQEKVLEFELFDLGSCVQPYKPICTPTTCAAQGIQCGPAGDGCGGPLDCGPCPTGQICGGGGPGKCAAPVCTPTTCAALGFMCGPAGDLCGNLLDCGPCPPGQTCGGGGKPGVCGSLQCTPIDCTAQNLQCGPAGDGCGNTIDCGMCPPPQVCGGGGPGKCGAPQCTPTTCVAQGIQCGPAGDGCGNAIDCGPCPTGQICGFSGPGKCGGTK